MKKAFLSFVTVLSLIPCIAQKSKQQNAKPSSGCNGGFFSPWIDLNPQTQSICTGKTVSFTAQGSLVEVQHSWQMSTDGGITWSESIGNHTYSYLSANDKYYDTITIPVVYEGMNGYLFRVQYGNYCDLAYTNPATLLVSPGPTNVISQPSNTNTCINQPADFSITLQGGGFFFLPMAGKHKWWYILFRHSWKKYSITSFRCCTTTNEYQPVPLCCE